MPPWTAGVGPHSSDTAGSENNVLDTLDTEDAFGESFVYVHVAVALGGGCLFADVVLCECRDRTDSLYLHEPQGDGHGWGTQQLVWTGLTCFTV